MVKTEKCFHLLDSCLGIVALVSSKMHHCAASMPRPIAWLLLSPKHPEDTGGYEAEDLVPGLRD